MTAAGAVRRLVVFDLDGTLIDSRRVMTSAFRTAYARVVGPGAAPVAQFLQLLGAPFPDILVALGLPAEMYPLFRRLSAERIDEIRTHPAALDACRSIRERGALTAVLTGKDRRRTVDILTHLAVADLFDAVVGGDDLPLGKPAPDGVLWLCRRFGIPPASTLVVGDSAFDMAAGRAAGATTVGCLWGMSDRTELVATGADSLVERSDGLEAALLDWLTTPTPADRKAAPPGHEPGRGMARR